MGLGFTSYCFVLTAQQPKAVFFTKIFHNLYTMPSGDVIVSPRDGFSSLFWSLGQNWRWILNGHMVAILTSIAKIL
jgi:hypothetical protein